MTSKFNQKAHKVANLLMSEGVIKNRSDFDKALIVLEEQLENQERETKKEILNQIKELPDMNDLCGDSEVKWLDSDDIENLLE